MKKSKELFLCFIVALAALSTVSVFAWEKPVRIDGGGGSFSELSIKFGPSGRAYFVYHRKVVETGRHDILFRSYDGQKLSAETVLTAGNPYIISTLYPDIAVTRNEELHVAWLENNRGNNSQYIMYRYFNGKSWGPIETLARAEDKQRFICEDLRIGADSNNNVFVVYMDPGRGGCSVISRYFGKKATVDFPVPGRSKHPDVVVDDKFVHITWQHRMNPDYGILYQKKPIKENSKWLPTVNLRTYGTQRPRLDLDNDGNPSIAYWEDRGADRRIWLRKWDAKLGLTSRANTIMLTSADYHSYHYLDFSIKNNSMFCSWQDGKFTPQDGPPGPIYYAYKKSNDADWNTNIMMAESIPSYFVANDQTWDGKVAGVLGSTSGSINLFLSDKLIINNLPVAVISADKDTIYWDEEVAFNGSGSSDSDGTIVKYEWWVIQDKLTLDGSSVTYRFNRKFGAIKVRLTVTDNKGGTGIAEKTITVNALFTPRSKASKQHIKTLLYDREGYVVTWEPNTKNDQAGYNIVKYKIYRKEAGIDYQEIGEVNATKLIFADVTVEAGKTYAYGVSAVDDQGHKSPCGLYNNY